MLRKILLSLILLFSITASFAQKVWTLEECVDYALKNNLRVQQSKAQAKISANNYQQSKLNLLPNLNASATNNYNFGRSIDPFTNQYAVQQVRSNNLSISSSVTLFNGLQLNNTVKQQSYTMQAATYDLKTTENTIALNIASAYLQVLLNEELVEINRNQVQATEQQLERAKKLVEAGNASANVELDMRAQLAQEKLNLINAQNQVKASYLTLWQLLEIDPNPEDKILKPTITQNLEALPEFAPKNVYSAFAETAPEIKAAEMRISASDFSRKIAQGALSPRLSLTASISTLFSQSFKTAGGEVLIGQRLLYVDNMGNPIYAPYYVPTTTKVTPFNEQINNNLGRFVGLSLSIPIFNGGQVRNNISNAKQNLLINQINLQQTKNNVYRDVTNAVNDYESSKAKYQASEENLEAQKKSYDFATSRNDAGLLNFAEYAIIKNNYTRAEQSLAQSKYELLFRMKIIEFYNTGKITKD